MANDLNKLIASASNLHEQLQVAVKKLKEGESSSSSNKGISVNSVLW